MQNYSLFSISTITKYGEKKPKNVPICGDEQYFDTFLSYI